MFREESIQAHLLQTFSDLDHTNTAACSGHDHTHPLHWARNAPLPPSFFLAPLPVTSLTGPIPLTSVAITQAAELTKQLLSD